MFYEMLTGKVAFPAPTEYARLGAVLNTTPPALETVDPQLARLQPIVSLAMHKDRTQRYQSALEMARALSAATGEAASSGPAPPISRLPDVPSVWMPTNAAQPSPVTPVVPAHPTLVDTNHGRTGDGDRHPATMVEPPTDKGPGGTLASRPGRPVTDPPPQIMIASQGTLPSENLPMLRIHGARKGVAVWAVVVLVIGALIAGFLLGLATATTMR